MSNGSLTISPLALHLISTSRFETIFPVEVTDWRTGPRSIYAVGVGVAAVPVFARLRQYQKPPPAMSTTTMTTIQIFFMCTPLPETTVPFDWIPLKGNGSRIQPAAPPPTAAML